MQTLSLLGPVDICFSHGSFCGFKRGHLDLEVKKNLLKLQLCTIYYKVK